MSVRWFLLITMPSGLWFQKRFSSNIAWSKSRRPLSCPFTEIVFSISAAFSIIDSLLQICSNFSSCHTVFILLTLSGVKNLSLFAGLFVCLVSVQLACWHLKSRVSRWSFGQPWQLSPFLRRLESTIDVLTSTPPPANFSACTTLFSCPFA